MPSPSSIPQPERAKIVTPPVQNSIIVESVEEIKPVVVTRQDPVKLSRYVIRTRATIEPPPALQTAITVGQSPLVEAPPLRGRLAPSNAGRAMLAPLPIVRHNTVVNQPAQLAQYAQVQQVQPAQVVRPPLIIAPASRVRPTSYVYIPGLARDEFVQRPCADLDSLKSRLRTTFGWRLKRVFGGHTTQDTVQYDPFIAGSVASLCDMKGATPINCGTAFLWALISSVDRNLYSEESSGLRYFDANRKMYTSKAFKVMGAPQDNYMALTPGKKIPPKELVYDRNDEAPHCVGSEYMAQRKAAKPDDENRPAPIEPGALAGLRDDDVLYIVGHGNHRGGMLVYKVPVPSSHPVQDGQQAQQPDVCAHGMHFERWYVDPNALAALLRDDGLPKTHKYIEMWMCYGAGVAISGEQTVQTFCGRLAGTLGGFGYKRIQVRGVIGLTYPDLSINPSLTPIGQNLIINSAPTNDVKPTASGYAKLYRSFAAK